MDFVSIAYLTTCFLSFSQILLELLCRGILFYLQLELLTLLAVTQPEQHSPFQRALVLIHFAASHHPHLAMHMQPKEAAGKLYLLQDPETLLSLLATNYNKQSCLSSPLNSSRLLLLPCFPPYLCPTPLCFLE